MLRRFVAGIEGQMDRRDSVEVYRKTSTGRYNKGLKTMARVMKKDSGTIRDVQV